MRRSARARLQSLATVLLLTSLAACGRDRAVEPGVTRADSAGVQVVVSSGADTVLPWRFEEAGVLRDSLGAPYLFTRVWRGGVLTDRAGRTYVLTGDPAIIRFGRDDRAERVIGRRGGGPGEMQLPSQLGAKGDTIFVLDPVKAALVRWSPTLDPIADQRLEGAVAQANRIAFRTGGLWMQTTVVSDSGRRILFHVDTSGPPAHVVDVAATGSVRTRCISVWQVPQLFAPTLSWSAEGARALVNAGSGYDLWLYEGPRPIASIRRTVVPRAPTADDVRELYPDGWRVAVPGGTACVVPVDEVMQAFGVAPVYPAVHDLVLLADGTIWVQRNPREAAVPVIDVFAPNGAYAGTVRGMRLPVGRLPNGELLIPRPDEDSGGDILARVRVAK